MTVHQARPGQATGTAPLSRQNPAGLSVPFAPLAVVSVALMLLGFHADVFGPRALGRVLVLPAWIVSTMVVAALWVVLAVRSRGRIPVPKSLIPGGLFIMSLFSWTALQALVSLETASGLAAATQVMAGLTLFMIVASLVAQSHDFEGLNRMVFALGALIAGLVVLAALLGVAAHGIGSGMLPGLLAISLFAGVVGVQNTTPARWEGLLIIIVALSLSVTPALLAILSLALAIVMAARLAFGKEDRPSSASSRPWLGLLLPIALVAGLLFFNGAFDSIQGTALGYSGLIGGESYLAYSSSSGGWGAAAGSLALWALFVAHVGVKALRILKSDSSSVVWTFGLALAVTATLVVSISYQPLIWLTAAVVVGRYSRNRRIAAFREPLKLDS